MGVTTTNNKPINPRGNDQSPKGYNRAALYSGKALDFDGVNDVVNGEAPNLPSSDYTICTYFRIDYLSVGGMITWGDFATGERRSMLIWDGGHNGKYTLRSSTYGSNPEGSTYLKTGEWYLGCVSVASNGEAKIYLNGQLDGSGTNTLNAYTNTDYLVGRTRATTEFFDGALSNTRIFNQVLTAAQVADLYNNPEKVVPTGVDNTALKLWLPMMEGAGTTAYDGSGNGNHGTISGATYVNGIGAPVAQSAVMDWNKGTNEVPQSNGFVEADSNYAYTNSSETEATITAPDGSTDAFEYICDAVTTNNQFLRINPSATYTSGQVYTYSLFVKYNTKQFVKLAYMNYSGSGYFVAAFDLVNGIVTDTNIHGSATNTSSFIEEAPNGWYRIGISASLTSSAGQAMNFEFNVIPSGTPTWSTYGRVNQTTTTSDKVYIYGASLIEGTKGVYVHTNGTAQTSEVLLPQGLTTGRDITGVNLFENVRKQGALNLDGNSWAEVHDNESVDLADGVSLECWVYRNGESGYFGFVGKWVNNGNRSYLIATEPSNVIGFYVSKNGSALVSNSYTLSASGWHHLVGTEDGTNLKLYVDGVLVDTDATIAGDIFTSAYNVEIGRYNNSTSNEYANQIAQPRIYNRALTAEEVQRNYNAGKNTYTN